MRVQFEKQIGGTMMKRFATMMGALLLVPTMACADLIGIAELTKEVPETWLEKIDVNGKTVSQKLKRSTFFALEG